MRREHMRMKAAILKDARSTARADAANAVEDFKEFLKRKYGGNALKVRIYAKRILGTHHHPRRLEPPTGTTRERRQRQ